MIARAVPNDEHENRQCNRPDQTNVNRILVHRLTRPVDPVSRSPCYSVASGTTILPVKVKGSASHDGTVVSCVLRPVNESNDSLDYIEMSTLRSPLARLLGMI